MLEAALGEAEARRAARERSDAAARQAREVLSESERRVEGARREAARVGAELAAANQFLRSQLGVGGAQADAPARSSGELRIEDGFELALAAALGGRLDAALVEDVPGAQRILDRAGPEGGSALLAGGAHGGDVPATGQAPAPGARRLIDLLSGPPAVLELAARLLADAWVVERLEELPGSFGGIAATRAGRVWFAAWGEVRQLSEGGTELVLARRNERDRLIADVERAAQAEQRAKAAGEEALEGVRTAEAARAEADDALREAERRHSEAKENVRRIEWLLSSGARRRGRVRWRCARPSSKASSRPSAARPSSGWQSCAAARPVSPGSAHSASPTWLWRPGPSGSVMPSGPPRPRSSSVVAALEIELGEDRQAGEEMTGKLRECAAREADIQSRLRSAGELVTEAEVAAQRLRDQAAEAELESAAVAERLGLDAAAGEDAERAALSETELAELASRVERLNRRREQLGPVNPLAQDEYAEAIAHVEELETQRGDLETALRELRTVIRETDRQIQETFEQTFQAAAKNFEELVGDVFPGGSGRLRLVEEEEGPRGVLGGQPLPAEQDPDEAIEQAAEAEAQAEENAQEEQLPGVEIEITPAGKSSKRLTLLSGGEKSMTALAFLFAVFLARPCPFYILDEVEAALDDLNLDRFLALLRRYAGSAQFIVITHQKRTMEAADWLFGVSMGGDGVSKVLSRRLPGEPAETAEVSALA